MDAKEKIARRAAREMREGDVVNLGIGLPTLVADFIPESLRIVLQSENGLLGMDALATDENRDKNITNAGGVHVTVKKGAVFFDSAASFSIIRGGHVDVTVLGALQVDEAGSLASHIIPGKRTPGMGGAMDLAAGSKRMIVTTTHTTKDGAPKILERLTLPVTAVGRVSLIVTELAVIEVTPRGLVLREIAEETSVGRVQSLTGAKLIVDGGSLKTF